MMGNCLMEEEEEEAGGEGRRASKLLTLEDEVGTSLR